MNVTLISHPISLSTISSSLRLGPQAYLTVFMRIPWERVGRVTGTERNSVDILSAGPTITTTQPSSVHFVNLSSYVTSSKMTSRIASGKQAECCPLGCELREGLSLLWTLAQNTGLAVL